MSSRPTKSAPSFVTKLYTIVNSGNTDVVDWHRGGTSFIIKDAERFSKLCLTPNFKSSLFSSFVRQLHFCKCVPHPPTLPSQPSHLRREDLLSFVRMC